MRNLSTIEHLHTLKTLIKKTKRKALDTVEYWSFIKVLRNAKIDQR